MSKTKFELVIAIINSGYSELVMSCAKKAGAGGGTVLHARGTGDGEIAKIFNVEIEPEKELIMIIVPSEDKESIMKAVAKGAGLTTEAKGIVFSMPVEDTLGIFTRKTEAAVKPVKDSKHTAKTTEQPSLEKNEGEVKPTKDEKHISKTSEHITDEKKERV